MEGLIDVKPETTTGGKHYWNVLVYKRELTEKELKDYELDDLNKWGDDMTINEYQINAMKFASGELIYVILALNHNPDDGDWDDWQPAPRQQQRWLLVGCSSLYKMCTRCVQDEIGILNTFKALILLGFLIGVQDGKDKS